MKPEATIAPTHLAVETTNICNARCRFCPSPVQTRARGVMGMDLFKKIVLDAETLGTVDFVTHGGMGEPLIDTGMVEKIAFEKGRLQAVVQLHTNGSLLTEEIVRELFESGLDVLSISLNAYQPASHKSLTGLDYDSVKRNTENAFGLKAALGAGTRIRLTMVKTRAMGDQEVEDFRRHWNRFTDDIVVLTEKNWASHEKNTVRGDRVPCKWIWYMMSVNWDGKVSICHEDFDARVVIGDLRTASLTEVFNCDEMRRLRRQFHKGAPEPAGLCGDCSRLVLDDDFWRNASAIALPSGLIKYCARRL